MSGVRESLDKKFNLSSVVLDLIIKSWSEGTAKQYAPYLRRWFSFYSENGLQPINADAPGGTKFWTQYFRKSICKYCSVNTDCSVLSSILPVVNGFTFGEQPLIKRLLQGKFEKRSTFPRYIVTYDLKYIPDYVKKCSIFSETSLELTSKSFGNCDIPFKWTKDHKL